MLAEEHPGIDNEDVAVEVIDALLVVMRKYILKEKELPLEGIGKIEIRRIDGSDSKKDARTGIVYKTSPRNVLKFKPSDAMKRLLNLEREKSTPLSSEQG